MKVKPVSSRCASPSIKSLSLGMLISSLSVIRKRPVWTVRRRVVGASAMSEALSFWIFQKEALDWTARL